MKVYEVSLQARFYVLAEGPEQAEAAAKVLSDFDEIEACLPYQASPYFSSYQTPNQSDEMRRRCVNFDDGHHNTVGKTEPR